MIRKQVRCVIVGNGKTALDREAGEEIDSFDKVVRINNFKIEGYEKYVGTKTDMLFTCDLLQYNSKELISVFPEVVLSLLQNDPLLKPEVLNSENITKRIDWNFAKFVGKKANIQWEEYPSTGLICIYYLLFNRGYDIMITGFDNFKDGRGAHYSEPDRQNFPSRHNGEKEKLYIRKLHEFNKLKYLNND